MAAKENVEEIDRIIKKAEEYGEKKQYVEAIKTYKTILLMFKDIDIYKKASIYVRIANLYYNLNDREKFTYNYEKYLEYYPTGQSGVFSRLGAVYYNVDIDKSIDYHAKGLNLEVNKYNLSCKLFAMTKSFYYDQQDLKDEAEYTIGLAKNTLFKNIKKYNHDAKKNQKDKKLNIGYLSSDCHSHTMMNYIVPIWENHNKEKYNFIIFNGSQTKDSVSEHISKLGLEIIPCIGDDIEKIAKTIYERDTDILIDLGGYTHFKTFTALYKPAPIIISYLGYLNTLGMSEVDYILADRFSIPEDKACLYTEKPLYLDKGYQVFIPKNFPEVEDSPFKTNNYITFGSFNCPSKINNSSIHLWTEILKQLPEARLIIYRYQLTKDVIKAIKAKFIKEGADLDRISFMNQQFNPHMKAYSMADIALDTFPFSGMSIAIENALMGVPTIAMYGEGIQSRGAARINHVLGFDEFNAEFGEDYIKNAVNLANDKEKLENLRKTLRDKIKSSPIIAGAEEFTRDLEAKYEQAWNDFTNNP